MQEGLRQAESNLKFLHVLKDPCADLADAKPADIPNMLPKILNLIRMIWVNSEFYKTRERLTGLLRKVIQWGPFIQQSIIILTYALSASSSKINVSTVSKYFSSLPVYNYIILLYNANLFTEYFSTLMNTRICMYIVAE